MERTEVINRTEKPNSFSGRWGAVGTDFKIFFESLEDLKEGIDAVIAGKKYLTAQLVEGGEARD